MRRVVVLSLATDMCRALGLIKFEPAVYAPDIYFAVAADDGSRWLWRVDDLLVEEWSRQ